MKYSKATAPTNRSRPPFEVTLLPVLIGASSGSYLLHELRSLGYSAAVSICLGFIGTMGVTSIGMYVSRKLAQSGYKRTLETAVKVVCSGLRIACALIALRCLMVFVQSPQSFHVGRFLLAAIPAFLLGPKGLPSRPLLVVGLVLLLFLCIFGIIYDHQYIPMTILYVLLAGGLVFANLKRYQQPTDTGSGIPPGTEPSI
jgi:hypothetical protein